MRVGIERDQESTSPVSCAVEELSSLALEPTRQRKKRSFSDPPPSTDCFTSETPQGTEIVVHAGTVNDGVDIPGSKLQRSMPKKRVSFTEEIEVKFVPLYSDYPPSVREKYWNSTEEIYSAAERNHFEFEAEGYDWRQSFEEKDFFEHGDELVHPAHFASETLFDDPSKMECDNVSCNIM